MMVKKNTGFTLVELLVVIAILAVIISAAGLSISLAASRDAQKCAKIIDSALESARMLAMSKQGTFEMVLDIDNHTLDIADNSEHSDLQRNVSISVQGHVDADTVSIIFDKSTGSVLQVAVDGVLYGESVLRITSENRNGKRATVVLIVNTGKHYVEYR